MSVKRAGIDSEPFFKDFVAAFSNDNRAKYNIMITLRAAYT